MRLVRAIALALAAGAISAVLSSGQARAQLPWPPLPGPMPIVQLQPGMLVCRTIFGTTVMVAPNQVPLGTVVLPVFENLPPFFPPRPVCFLPGALLPGPLLGLGPAVFVSQSLPPPMMPSMPEPPPPPLPAPSRCLPNTIGLAGADACLPPAGPVGILWSDGKVIPLPEGEEGGARFSPPGLVSPDDASQCKDSSSNEGEFDACMVQHIGHEDPAIQAAASCYSEEDTQQRALCVAQAFGGDTVKRAVAVARDCLSRSDDQDEQITCAGEGMTGGEAKRVLGCINQEQGQASATMDDFSFSSVAVCYGNSLLKANMNREAQVVASCAIVSGGEPMTFATCSGGELTSMELKKCWEDGVGTETGCFGPNNIFIKDLGRLGIHINRGLRVANGMVTFYKNSVGDIEHGPSESNDGIRAAVFIANNLNSAANKVDSVLGGLVPHVGGFRISF